MKSKKRVKGFTLVELIVVIAIIGVLTGVLIPNALAWIRNSKLKTCNSEAKTVFNTAVTVLQDYQLEGKVGNLVSTNDNTTFSNLDSSSNEYNEAVQKIEDKLGDNFDNVKFAIRVSVTNYDNRNTNTISVMSVLLSENSTSPYIGRYPVPSTKKYSYDINTAKGDTNITENCGSDSDPLID